MTFSINSITSNIKIDLKQINCSISVNHKFQNGFLQVLNVIFEVKIVPKHVNATIIFTR